MIKIKVYLGEKGLNKSWQEPFPEITKCHKCGGEARIMFVGFEKNTDDEAGSMKYICDLRENGGKGDYWVHDVIACAVYLCRDCFNPITLLNQA